MAFGRTRTVLDVLIRGLLFSVFLLLSPVVPDPVATRGWNWSPLPPHGSWAVPRPKVTVKTAPAVPASPVKAVEPLVAQTLQPPPVLWAKSPRSVTGILERLREEVGSDVSLWDFVGPGTLDSFWSWIGTSGPTTPFWMKATVKSVSTSFGMSRNLNLFMTSGDARWAVSLLNQNNSRTYFPGLNLELYEYPFHLANNPILITPRLSLWAQPQGGLTDSSVWQWGGLWLISLEVPFNEEVGLWVEGLGKTEGWAQGVDDTSASWALRTGIHWML